MSINEAWSLYPFERRFFINKFIEQKEKEQEAAEKMRKKKR